MDSPEDITDDSFEDEVELTHEEYQEQERQYAAKIESEVIADPTRDYYEELRPQMPKLEIGRYVRDQGFSVPIIETKAEWRAAFDDQLGFIRSESYQDYTGYAGLYSSKRVGMETGRLPDIWTYHEELVDLLCYGLRNGNLSPREYMTVFEWYRDEASINYRAAEFGVVIPKNYPDASLWRYIEGENIRVFKDPHVDGRYHFGVEPYNGAVGGYQVEADEHNKELRFRKHKQPFVAGPFIEYYEKIRSLPRFDTGQCPVMELQRDFDGNIHFLQYYKTGHRVEPSPAFELPANPRAIRATNARGVTKPDGAEYKIYISPKRYTKNMNGQGFYFGAYNMRGFKEQYLASVGSLVVHEAYVSFEGDHFSSTPLYRPPLAIGLERQEPEIFKKLHELEVLIYGKNIYDKRPDHNVYINAHVTSNGREAIIETDWQPHFEEY